MLLAQPASLAVGRSILAEALGLRTFAHMRFPPLAEASLSTEQARAAEELIARGVSISPDKALVGPLIPWIRSPDMAVGLQAAIDAVMNKTSVAEALKQLAVLLSARRWNCALMQAAHEPKARSAGISQDAIQCLKRGQKPAGLSEQEATLFDLSEELWTTRRVGDETFARAKTTLGERHLIELIGIMGISDLVAATFNLAQMAPPAPQAGRS